MFSSLDIAGALYRHQHGDWDEVGKAGWQANERALKQGERLLSVYRTAAVINFGSFPSGTTVLPPCCCQRTIEKRHFDCDTLGHGSANPLLKRAFKAISNLCCRSSYGFSEFFGVDMDTQNFSSANFHQTTAGNSFRQQPGGQTVICKIAIQNVY